MKIDGTNGNLYINQNPGIKSNRSFLRGGLGEDVLVLSRAERPKDEENSFATKISKKITDIIYSILPSKNARECVSSTEIPSKSFSTAVTKDKYLSSSVVGRNLGISYLEPEFDTHAKIAEKFNPGTLEIAKKVQDYSYASNFDSPRGSVALPSTLDKTLVTSELFQCAGVAFVDKSHNLQTLLHFAPGVQHEDNKALVEYILSYMKPEDTEITIVPGYFPDTNASVACLTQMINDVSPDYNINYMNFPDNENTALVLKNGELKCCEKFVPKKESINPENMIVWASHKVVQ